MLSQVENEKSFITSGPGQCVFSFSLYWFLGAHRLLVQSVKVLVRLHRCTGYSEFTVSHDKTPVYI